MLLGILGECYALLRERQPQDGGSSGVRYAAAQPDAGADGERPGAPPAHQARPREDVPVGGPADQPEPRLPGPGHCVLPVA